MLFYWNLHVVLQLRVWCDYELAYERSSNWQICCSMMFIFALVANVPYFLLCNFNSYNYCFRDFLGVPLGLLLGVVIVAP